MKLFSIASLLVLLATNVSAASFVQINGEKFCAGSQGLAYKYLYDWKEGGWGITDINLKGLMVYDFKSNNLARYKVLKANPVPGSGVLYERIVPSRDHYRFLIVYSDRRGGAVTLTSEFKNNRPVSPVFDEVNYLLNATYQPWEYCN